MALKNNGLHSSILIKMIFLMLTFGIGTKAIAASEWMCGTTLAYHACCCSYEGYWQDNWVIDPSNTSDTSCENVCNQGPGTNYYYSPDSNCTPSSPVFNDSRSLSEYMKELYNATC